jgi:hypothetical protein
MKSKSIERILSKSNNKVSTSVRNILYLNYIAFIIGKKKAKEKKIRNNYAAIYIHI